MNKKIGFIFVSTLFLVTALMYFPLTFAQELRYWDSCKVSAYGFGFTEMETGEIRSISFNVAAPPSGSDITNTLEVKDYVTGENYTITLSTGDAIVIRYDAYPPLSYSATPAAESNHHIIYFEGAVVNVTIGGAVVPEFPPILAVPLFITATLLAIIYRRKRTT